MTTEQKLLSSGIDLVGIALNLLMRLMEARAGAAPALELDPADKAALEAASKEALAGLDQAVQRAKALLGEA